MLKSTTKLYAHQVGGLNFLLSNNGGLLAWDCGTGKTLTALAYLDELRKTYPEAKMLVVCPLTLIESAWIDDIEKFSTFAYCNLRKGYDPKADIFLINYESYKIKMMNYKAQFSRHMVCILDECFDGDTLVDTPSGKRKIKHIKEGDKIVNCTGVDTVIGTKVKTLDSWVKITYNNETIKCSLNHPFFTTEGWKYAQDIREGDTLVTTRRSQQILRRMSKKVLSLFNKGKICFLSQKETFLRSILFSEMENVSTRTQSKDIHKRSCREDFKKNEKVLCERLSNCKSEYRENKKVMSFYKTRSSQKNIKKITRDKLETAYSWWEWSRFDGSTTKTFKPVREILDSRICNIFRKEAKWLSNLLQSRFSAYWFKISYRIRQLQSLFASSFGSKERCQTGYVRVDSIKIYKSDGKGEYGRSFEENQFYDLKVERHPSFSVNSVLVHNSSKIKSSKAQITKALLKDRDSYMWRVCMSATPAPNSELEYWSQAQFITPGVLPENYFVYRNTFFRLERGGQRVEGWMKANIISDLMRKGFKYCLSPQKSEYFNAQLGKITMRQRKEDCLDLPEQIDVVRYVEMGAEQKRHYNDMKQHCVALINDETITAQIKLVQIMKLRQITSGWLYDTEGGCIDIEDGNGKMRELESLIEENKTEKMIIWCTFKQDIKRIEKNIARLYGDEAVVTAYSESDTQESIRRFKNDGACRYIVAHPKSIGHGVTLTNCSLMVFYSLDYSYELYEQARGRTHRAGQRNPCTNIVLLSRNTIDKVVYDVVRKKMDKQELLTRL